VLPSLSGSRSAANILQLDAREEISRGHAAAAIDDANAIFGFSRHIGQRPFLVAAHVGMGIDALGGYTLGLALPVVKTRDELARLHLEELTSLAHIFQQGLRSEERFGLTLYGNMLGLQITTAANHDYRLATVPPLGSGWGGVFFRAFLLDLDSYTKFMEDMQDAATQPYYKIQGQISDAFGLGRERGLVLSIVEPALNRTLQMLATGEVYDACDQTAVAMTKYRLDHGMLPSHLGDLVPAYLDAVPTDPFDGHPLRLVVRNGEWIIYSVGPDGIDNGGTRIDRSRYDILFTLKPTATRAATQP
jgi:hypothetical protein